MTGPTGRRIPVIVLAGFLGSGKTTLLNHLLRHSEGTRIGALVNDFGSIEIDAMTVAGQVDAMVSLGDGCLCCAVDTGDMDDALERLARPSVGMDVIVVEASGLAEPETLIRMILASRSEHIRYGGLVEVVDAAEFDEVSRRHPELERHVRAADLVVLNKSDRVPEAGRRTLGERLEALSPGTPVVCAAYGRIDPGLLFDPARRERPGIEQLSFDVLLRAEDGDSGADGAGFADDCGDGREHAGHLHAAYESVEFTSALPLQPRPFLDFLDGRPAGVYRIKGFVDFGAADPGRRYEVHAVGGFLRFTPGRWASDEERLTQLVLIGSGFDADALRGGLAACAADEAAEPEPRAMWGVLRYVDAVAGRGAGPGAAGAGSGSGSGAYGDLEGEPDDEPREPHESYGTYEPCEPDEPYEPSELYGPCEPGELYGPSEPDEPCAPDEARLARVPRPGGESGYGAARPHSVEP